MFLRKPNHELLSYLVCGLHHFFNLEGPRILRDKFWETTKFKSTTVITRFSITVFHSFVSKIIHSCVFVKTINIILQDLKNIKPK